MRRQALLAAAFAAAASGVLASAALADGVVIESSSSAHAVGDRVAVDSVLAIEDGAEVAVLDRSGAVQRYSEGARYQVPPSPPPPARSQPTSVAGRLAANFTSLGRRAGLGSTRSVAEACGSQERRGRSIPSPQCVAARAAEEALRNEPWSFSLQSQIEGRLTCDYAADEDAWRRLPLADDGAPLPIAAGAYEFSSADRDAWPDGLVASDEAFVVRCQAIDPATWDALAPLWNGDYDAEQAHALMETFAAVRGGTFVEAAVEE